MRTRKARRKKKKYNSKTYKSGYGEWINGNKKVVATKKQKAKDKREKYKSYIDYN